MKINNRYSLFAAVFLLGALWAFSMRFLLVSRELTHYHANFAIYVDGVRDPLEEFTFYEEVAACSPEYEDAPKSRVHLHDNEPATIHVHSKAVTWGNFFENIEYSISNKVLETDAGVFIDGQDDKQLRYLLNGKFVRFVPGKLMVSEDTLLVDYSSDTEEVLLRRYSEIPREAAEYNQKDDPASCQGGSEETFGHRLKRTLGLDE